MKGLFKTAIAITIMAIAIGCDLTKTTLNVYCWDNYISNEVIEVFEKKYNCKVEIDTFESNEEMFERISRGCMKFDVVIPSSYQIPMMVKHKLLRKIDHSKLPNVSKFYDRNYDHLLIDTNMTYNIPYALSITGIAYRKDLLPEGVFADGNISIFTNTKLLGKTMMLDDLREVVGLSLITLGFDSSSTNMSEIMMATDVACGWMKTTRKDDIDLCRAGLLSGEIAVAQIYSADAHQCMDFDENMKSNLIFKVPSRTTACFDEMVLLDCRNSEQSLRLAYAFIDFMYMPENAAKTCEYIYSAVPNKGMYEYLMDDIRNNEVIVPSTNTLSRCEIIRDVGDNMVQYIKAWGEISNGKLKNSIFGY